ncbi:MAG: TonB-dependent receptor [Pedobacter sp.]|nr:MAG: TonB-dependent receptor [Pedobacter sp.]
MKKLSLTLLLSLFCSLLFAQSPFFVKGRVIDSASNVKLKNATISILNAKDSTLHKFTRANEQGDFKIQTTKPGDFILLLTYPEYADYVYQFKLDDTNPSLDLKSIDLKLKATLLNEVIIKGKVAAIKIKGDTTEFNAASYTIQPNDKVEDLLKKLPGIQVDKDGKITAQGKTVPKVLVDGEEFFGDDPTLVTKNLRADMVDKVQLYEKRSDQAVFTGVDDGVKTQTINIQLKEDKKNGYFGKAELGIGSNKFYQGQAMFNAFKAKQKFSVFGVVGNNGKTGLDFRDRQRLATENQNVEFMDGGIAVYGLSSGDLDSWGGQYYGEGIPQAKNSGVHYDTKWNKDKQSINANYRLGSLRVEGLKNTITQNNLPNGLINTNADQATNNYTVKQGGDAIYQIKLDTTSNLKITLLGNLKESDTENKYTTIGARGDKSLINTSSRLLTSTGTEKSFNATAFYTKRLRKKGRTFSLNINQGVDDNDLEGFLNSQNNFYAPDGSLTGSELIDQFKISKTKSLSSSARATYTEPLSEKLSLVLNYAIGLSSSNAERKSFNSSGVRYDLLDTLFSNHFEVDQLSNQAGAIFNYREKKNVVNFGTQVNNVDFKQLDVMSNTEYKRSFLNWIPQVNYQYSISSQKSLRLSYNGRTRQPSVTQLQPVLNNNDPLNIPLGNPNLRPSYSNSFEFGYSSYKVITSQQIYISGSYSFISNSIISNRVTDPTTGATISQAINLVNKMPTNYNLYSDFGRELNFLDLEAGLNLGTSGGTSYNYINNSLSTNKRTNYNFGFTLSKSVEKKYEFDTNFETSYNVQQSSLQQGINNNGWSYSGNGSLRIFLPGKIEINSDLTYERTAKTESFNDNLERVVLNSSITKKFLKNDNLRMSISGNDLFNQNVGFSRFANENILTQSSHLSIQRFFMYTITWDFNKMGAVKK